MILMRRGQDQQEGDRNGFTEAEPAVKPKRKIRRGREMAGLPQGGETPLGFSFLNPNSQVFCPHFHFLGPEDFYNSLFVAKFTLSFQNHHVNRTPDVETCCAENKCKIFAANQKSFHKRRWLNRRSLHNI